MDRVLALFLCGMFALSCRTYSDDHASPSELALTAGIHRVVLEVGYQKGAVPYVATPRDPWQLFRANAEALLGEGKELVFPSGETQMELLNDVTGDVFGDDDLLAIAKAHRTKQTSGDTVAYYAIWISGYYRDAQGQQRNDVAGVTVGDDGVLAIFRPVVNTLAITSDGKTSQSLAVFAEQSTLIHEFGHAVGLVNHGIPMASPHQDTPHGAHCTNEHCVMYYVNDGAAAAKDFIAEHAKTGSLVLFGDECLADAKAARK
jgi:hypothetical protein